jgi:hypothetical protein
MLTLRRLLIAALLTGFLIGCGSKTKSSDDSNKTPKERKLEKAREADKEGPELRK